MNENKKYKFIFHVDGISDWNLLTTDQDIIINAGRKDCKKLETIVDRIKEKQSIEDWEIMLSLMST